MEKDKKIIKWILPAQKKSAYKVKLPEKKREWMDVNNGHAYKCLPLTVANGYGWEVLNPVKFDATWTGDLSPKNQIKFNFYPENEEEQRLTKQIYSHFGNGIITFSSLNFIFRTTEGHNLFIKGPTNHFKHGAHALEAIVETDWLPYTFTLNWKLTKANETVFFEKGEPISCIFPIQRGYLESFDAVEYLGDPDSEFSKQHDFWANKRSELKTNKNRDHAYYIKGLQDAEEKRVYESHQKVIRASEFRVLEFDQIKEHENKFIFEQENTNK